MDAKEHKSKSMESFRENWPTPAESMSELTRNNPLSDFHMEYSKIEQLQLQAEQQMDISFLQPSVIYSSPEPENYLVTSHSILDIGRDRRTAALNPNIHIWSRTLDEEMDVAKNIHPAILSQLKPCKTKDDHNCLYNAICLCLGIPESQQNVLRELTVSCLRKHSKHFTELLKASDEISLQTLIEQCQQPFCSEGWGNEFHLLALAIMLKRNIVVYTSFKSPKGQFYQRKNKNIVGLAEEFKQGGDKIEQHMNFEPQQGITCDDPICIYLNGAHFTALVPRLPNPIYCVPPSTNLPSIPNNGILSNLSDSQMHDKRMTRKARWLASMTPAQLAEYKARQKAKKKEKKAIQEAGNSDNAMVAEQLKSKSGNKRKSIQQKQDIQCYKKKKESTNVATILHPSSTQNTTTMQQHLNFSGKRRDIELSSVEDESYHKKKKDTEKPATTVSPSSTHNTNRSDTVVPLCSTKERRAAIDKKHKIKEACQIRQKAEKNASDVPSIGTVKLTKAEINRRYYEKNKDKIKAARVNRHKDPVTHATELAKRRAAYRNPVNHAAELAKRKAAYAVTENRMAKLAAKKKAYSDPVNQATQLAKRKAAYAVTEKRMAKLTAQRKAYRDPVNHAAKLANMKAAYAVPEKHMAKLAAQRKAYRDPVNHAAKLANMKALYAVPEKHMAKLGAQRKAYRNPVNHAAKLARMKASYESISFRKWSFLWNKSGMNRYIVFQLAHN